ncbi:LysR substrate-binding domain-containing protein [Noviherbaspirillum aerium]|uniref:LysR substrate-binding domain-containing protein n=1 Tax=Noviherbaspirillum aerium TaxID=2588497 RepID=UPI00124C816E|nr:LysR substrate-binding domain-containing protein [Noviherbaspirillum aerium]
MSKLLALPPLDALRGFVAVARRMSITLAAQDLCLTQSALSRQVQALEAHFGTPLLVRKHRAIALTQVGEQLFEMASPWLDRIGEFSESVRGGSRPRPVTITASIGVTSLWILPWLGAFQSTHPGIDVRVAAHNSVLDLVQEGIDLAIRYCRQAQAPAGAVRLFHEQVVPVAHPALAQKAFASDEALLQQVLLEWDERGRPWLRWSDWLGTKGLSDARPRRFLHFNQYDQVIQAALDGHGVALGRLALVRPMLRDGRLVAHPGADAGVSDYAYWLVRAPGAGRAEVGILYDWILQRVEAGAD